jgi:lipid-A-disaccharide synthase
LVTLGQNNQKVQMKYYLIAGERSGDLHGGNLIRAIKSRDKKAEFFGFGGDEMAKAGASLSVHYRELAFMGFWEVLTNLRTISRYLRMCKREIQQHRPDVVILIDYAGFNLKIARFAKSKGVKVFYYISPKVWAWNQSRAYKIKRWVDRMFVILPFEREFYQKFAWEVDYVGNPVVDAVLGHSPQLQKGQFVTGQMPLVALLPGSRMQEIARILPVFCEVVSQRPHIKFLVAAAGNLPKEAFLELGSFPNVEILVDQSYDILSIADAALVTSGTATLETALWKVPQVVVYRTSPISYRIAKGLIRVPYISLVNLILNKEAVVELIQDTCTAANITGELDELLVGQKRKKVLADYEHLWGILGRESASQKAADAMLKYLR